MVKAQLTHSQLKLTEKASDRSISNVDTTTSASSIQSTTVGDGGGDIAWEGASSVNDSLQELVAFDDEGHPYIDVNKLAYKPRKKHHDHQKEKLSWYLPDFSFIVFNFKSLGCSTYFILIGNTTLTWKASIGMFSVPNCYDIHGYYHANGTRYAIEGEPGSHIKVDDFFFAPCEIFLHEKPFWNETYQEPGEGYNFSVPGSHPVLRTKLTDVHYLGLVLIVVSLVNALNVCVGINACLQGYKTILYGHIATDGVIVLVEFIICAAVHFTGRCEEKDIEIIRVILQHFIQWYGFIQKGIEQESAKEKLLTAEVDSLQIGLSCCGADGWQDFLASSDKYPSSPVGHARSEIDETEAVIPFSCCRPWWVRNIYCAHGVHRWGHPLATAAKAFQFQERINQEGCTFKLERMCYKIKSLMGVQGFVTSFVHLFFIIIEGVAAFVLVNNINDIIKEKKRAMKEREISHGPADGGEDDFELMDEYDEEQEVAKSKGGFPKMPPPTEDQIVTIKQRSNFNEFITKVKTSHVGHWMRHAQEKVTAGHENDTEYLTAEEKKARAKELLHKGKGRNDEDDDGHHHRHQKHHPSQLEGLKSEGNSRLLERNERNRNRRSWKKLRANWILGALSGERAGKLCRWVVEKKAHRKGRV